MNIEVGNSIHREPQDRSTVPNDTLIDRARRYHTSTFEIPCSIFDIEIQHLRFAEPTTILKKPIWFRHAQVMMTAKPHPHRDPDHAA